MADRVTIDIEGFRNELEGQAKALEGTINQCVRLAIKEWLERKRPQDKVVESEIEAQLVIQYVKKLLRGDSLTNAEMMLMAKILQEPPRTVMKLKINNGNGERSTDSISQ